jgi:hypothetical protein
MCGRLDAHDLLFGRVGRNGEAFVLQKRQVGLVEKNGLKPACVIGLVALDAVSPNSWTATCIEHPILEAGEIRVYGHFTAQCIEFENEVRFCQATDGRIAGHATQVGEGL